MTNHAITGQVATEPRRSNDPQALVDLALARVGRRVVLALPLGIGKGYRIANAFYARAQAERDLELTVVTALVLQPAPAAGELDRRFREPLIARLYRDVPRLAAIDDRRRHCLPPNVRVCEFFVAPGSALDDAAAQQSFVYTNYTHARRDLLAMGLNVVAQMVAPHPRDPSRCSFSCNPDLPTELYADLRHREAQGGAPAAIFGEVNPELPYFAGDAEVATERFDGLLEGQHARYPLPIAPSPALQLADHAIGLRLAALVRDGGTLQIGIGAIGDAAAHALRWRHTDAAGYAAALDRLPRADAELSLAEAIGGRERFEQGLYGCSEMLNEGLIALLEAGVIAREVGGEGESRRVLDGGFFLGPERFYQRLRQLPEALRSGINMTSVAKINALYGDEVNRRRQRRDARFLNSALQASALGAVNADSLADGRTVSGVGGQYNFVAMAQELGDGRAATALRATRERAGRTHSNLLWELPSQTVPRHLRDILVTEYGVADLRGRPDHEVAAAIIEIADARFQQQLVAQAKAAGKLPSHYRVPEQARSNTPETLGRALAEARDRGRLPRFPFGSELDMTEQALAEALAWLKAKVGRNRRGVGTLVSALTTSPRKWHDPHLARLGLDHPSGVREHALARLVAHALTAAQP